MTLLYSNRTSNLSHTSAFSLYDALCHRDYISDVHSNYTTFPPCYRYIFVPDTSLEASSVPEVNDTDSFTQGYDMLNSYIQASAIHDSYNTVSHIRNSLYNLDEELRSLFIKYLLHTEKLIKSSIADIFCEQFGYSQSAYLNPLNYFYDSHSAKDIHFLIHILTVAVSSYSTIPLIHTYNAFHEDVPLALAINALTFGQLTKMYHFLSPTLQSLISTAFHLSPFDLQGTMNFLSCFRNICAHGEPVYIFHAYTPMPCLPLHLKMNVAVYTDSAVPMTAHGNLFSVVISLRYLLPTDDFKKFRHQLEHILTDFFKRCPEISQYEFMNTIGFPNNWKNIMRYKL